MSIGDILLVDDDPDLLKLVQRHHPADGAGIGPADGERNPHSKSHRVSET